MPFSDLIFYSFLSLLDLSCTLFFRILKSNPLPTHQIHFPYIYNCSVSLHFHIIHSNIIIVAFIASVLFATLELLSRILFVSLNRFYLGFLFFPKP